MMPQTGQNVEAVLVLKKCHNVHGKKVQLDYIRVSRLYTHTTHLTPRKYLTIQWCSLCPLLQTSKRVQILSRLMKHKHKMNATAVAVHAIQSLYKHVIHLDALP